MGLASLLGEAGAGSARAAGGVDQERRHEGGADVVAHGVGDRQAQGVGVEAVVVGVPGDVGGRDQGAGQGELGCFTAGGGGQELALDLRGEADRGGAVAPVVEVGEAPVGDDDVRQRVRGVLDLGAYAGRHLGEEDLQDAEGVAAVGDRGQHPMPVLAVCRHDDVLAEQNVVVDTAARERDLFGRLLARLCGGVVDPQQASADDVDDVDDVDEQERHVPGVEPVAQIARHDIERAHGRGTLGCSQYVAEPEPSTRRTGLAVGKSRHGLLPSTSRPRTHREASVGSPPVNPDPALTRGSEMCGALTVVTGRGKSGRPLRPGPHRLHVRIMRFAIPVSPHRTGLLRRRRVVARFRGRRRIEPFTLRDQMGGIRSLSLRVYVSRGYVKSVSLFSRRRSR